MDRIQNVLLADDDPDDRLFFKEALQDLPINAKLTTVHDGVELMQFLSNNFETLPDVLFLDLNMPRKNGFECLLEIKSDTILKGLPVIIFSTSLDKGVVDILFDHGANYYIRKPADFSDLRNVMHETLSVLCKNDYRQPDKEHFIMNVNGYRND